MNSMQAYSLYFNILKRTQMSRKIHLNGGHPESTTTRTAGGLDFTAIGGKIQGRELPQSLKTTRFGKPDSNADLRPVLFDWPF
jgi:hypothetical protein